jgi:hypothetical protein
MKPLHSEGKIHEKKVQSADQRFRQMMPRQGELLSGFAGMQIAYADKMCSKWGLSP